MPAAAGEIPADAWALTRERARAVIELYERVSRWYGKTWDFGGVGENT